jgi:hypothetical protein
LVSSHDFLHIAIAIAIAIGPLPPLPSGQKNLSFY